MHPCIQGPKPLDIHHSICLVDGCEAGTQWAKPQKGPNESLYREQSGSEADRTAETARCLQATEETGPFRLAPRKIS